MTRGFWMTTARLALAMLCLLDVRSAAAADDGSIRGVVQDQLGGAIAGAQATAMRDGQNVKTATTDARGEFTLDGLVEGRYQVVVTAPGFTDRTSDAIFVAATGRVNLAIQLQITGLQADVLVTAAASDVSQAQTGASATVVDGATITALGNTELLEPLRSVPGVAVVQSGARGGKTALFVRGGASNFNKVIIDGVPANDIGGEFDLADLMTTGVDRVEVLRGSNSVLYGSDAMTSVVNITTRRGRTRTPEAMFSIDGGNLATSHEEASIGGAVERFDYFGAYSHLQTDNDVDNNDYRNDTIASRFGIAASSNTQVKGTLRWLDTDSGSPNAVDFYGISDDSRLDKTTVYGSVSALSQISDRWQSDISFGIANQDYHYLNPAPTGTPSDSSAFANYLGNVVAINGANGYSVTGRAILDYSDSYPSPYDATVRRSLLSGRTDYQVSSALNLAGGVRLEHERGTSASSFGSSEASRTNYGAFGEARVAALEHLFITGGLGVDHNEVFGTVATPRVSVAAYLRPPSSTAPFGDTKVTLNAGRGIKEPSVSQELSSLFVLVPPSTASSLGVEPVGPERSRTFDVGVEQGLAAGRGRVRVAYFNNEFKDLLEFVNKGVLPQLGVPVEVANQSGLGAYVNSQSNRARGVEVSGDVLTGPVRVSASYTYVDAIVTESFSSGALAPAENPAFPGIRIGQFTPLVGARPFRRPANSGSLIVTYTREKANVSLAGYFFGKQDDSTFLTDEFFGYSMLLPNEDLDAAYQKFNLSGSYRFHQRARGYVTLENLFDEKFAAAAGFPALPRTVRVGVTLTLGGGN
jgi:vitamin B12 transporter